MLNRNTPGLRRWRGVLAAAALAALFPTAQGAAQEPELARLRQSPCYPTGPLRNADGEPIKTRAQVCLEAIEGASAEEQAFLLDAAMSGLKIIAVNGFQDLPLESLEGAAALKGQTIRLGELSLRPEEENLERVRETLAETRAANDPIAEAYALRIYSEMLSRLGRFNEIETVAGTLKQSPIADRPHVRQIIFSRQRMVARGRGDMVEALANAEELIRLYEENGEPLLAGLVNYGIGNVLSDLGDYDAALARYEVAKRSLEDAGRTRQANYAIVRAGIGTILTTTERHAEALEEYRAANAIFETIDQSQSARITYFWMAKSLFAIGEEERALDLAWEAARLGPDRRDPLDTAQSLIWIAARELDRGDTAAAAEALDLAASLTDVDAETDLSTAFEGKDRYFAVAYARGMAELMAQTGDAEAGMRYAQYALDMNSDWLEAEKVQAAVDAEVLFEIRNKDQAIQLLESERNLQQAELALQGAALENQRLFTIAGFIGVAGLALTAGLAVFGWRSSRRLAAVRKTLVAEEHHRTKNALQMASSLVRAETRAGLSHRLTTMGLVYDHLRTAQETSSLEAEPFLRELVDSLSEALAPRQVECRLQCEPKTLEAGVATPLGLLICEMLINAFKHAFPDGAGRIEIALTGDQGARTLEVKDNGVGVGDAAVARRKGHGSQLIEDLASQLGAAAKMTQTPSGTIWRVAPLPV